MREAVLCVRHGHPLVALWTSTAPRHRFDIGARLEEIQDAILSGALDQPRRPPTAYDLWLDRRISDGTDETWFRHHSTHAVTTFCRLLGQSQQRASGSSDPDTGAHSAGFDAARGGPDAVREALRRIAATASGAILEPDGAFGSLYRVLANDTAREEAFDPFRRLLRDCILEHFPVAGGQVVLGVVLPERRLHSLRSAAAEAGVEVEFMQHFLVERGVLMPDDPRAPSRKLFDAQAHASVIEEAGLLVGVRAMKTAIGATRAMLQALTAEGLVGPRSRCAQIKRHWLVRDGEDLLRPLMARAVAVGRDEPGWEDLLTARKRSGVSLRQLFEAMRAGQLRTGRVPEGSGFESLVVAARDVDSLCMADAGQGVDDPGLTPLTEFDRSVGMRNQGHLSALVEGGHTPARRVRQRADGRHEYKLTPRDIVAFHERFCTLAILGRETGQHPTTLKALLNREGVLPFTAGERGFGFVYLRTDLARALEKLG